LTAPLVPPALPLDSEVEARVAALLVQHYAPTFGDRVDEFVRSVMAIEPYSSRFLYFKTVVGPAIFNSDSSVLVSGCGAGCEMIVARQWGFGEIYGVEVDPVWVSACEMRLAQLPGMHVLCYDGDQLPYSDAMFDVVTSGHVIEHTRDPGRYLAESLRVLKPGGFLNLEYPARYHHVELHTQLPSLEWLPRPLRDCGYRVLGSNVSPLAPRTKQLYRSIYETRLHQVSLPAVRRWLGRSSLRYTIVNVTRAAPGVTRLVVRRDPDGDQT
jgi:SAM-dependent methyltransferase